MRKKKHTRVARTNDEVSGYKRQENQEGVEGDKTAFLLPPEGQHLWPSIWNKTEEPMTRTASELAHPS
jgi:hypothetical protein